MDKVAELLKPFPYRTDTVTRDTKAFFKRENLIRDKLKSGELTPDDINTYNENDNPTSLEGVQNSVSAKLKVHHSI